MIDYLCAAWTKLQLTKYLALITHLTWSKVGQFPELAWFDSAIDKLISQTVWIRERISFIEKVDSIENRLFYPNFHYFCSEKNGLLTKGPFFSCIYDSEDQFVISHSQDYILFYQRPAQAFIKARCYLRLQPEYRTSND